MGLFGERCSICHKKRTKEKDEYDRYVCAFCKLTMKAEREETIRCPKDGTQMAKEIIEDIIIDKCPTCRGVWLDEGELDDLGELEED